MITANIDYAAIRVYEPRARLIADLYMSAPSDDHNAQTYAAFDAFAAEVQRQYAELFTLGYLDAVSVQDTSPYQSADEMFAAVRSTRTLLVHDTAATGSHPYFTDGQNNMFRAVHDYHGHYMTHRTFDRHGEEAAWARHSRMFSPLARRAMTTETRGQSSAFIFAMGGKVFPEQKITLLPTWVSEDI